MGEFLQGLNLSAAPEFGFGADKWRWRLRALAVHGGVRYEPLHLLRIVTLFLPSVQLRDTA